jgi:hypothetical protein
LRFNWRKKNACSPHGEQAKTTLEGKAGDALHYVAPI